MIGAAVRAALRISLVEIWADKVQAALVVLGVMMGAIALTLSVATIRSGHAMIEAELTAAGINMIVIRAGNYQLETPDDGGEAVGHHADIAFRGDESEFVPGGASSGWRLRPAVLWREEGQDMPFRFIHEGHEAEDRIEAPGFADRPGDRAGGFGAANTLNVADGRALANQIDVVQAVAALAQGSAPIARSDDPAVRRNARLIGVDEAFLTVHPTLALVKGRGLRADEVANAAPVILLGRALANRLFDKGENPTGRVVQLAGRAMTVVGVVGSEQTPMVPAVTGDPLDAAYAPLPLVQGLLGIDHVQALVVATRSVGESASAVRAIGQVLRARHGLSDMMPDDFIVHPQSLALLAKGLPPAEVRSLGANLEAVDRLLATSLGDAVDENERSLGRLLYGCSAVLLFLGGAGIAVRMALAVGQRSGEIGLRMSQGATGRDISLQFFTEGLCLGFAGGALGIGLALLFAASVAMFAGMPFMPSLSAALVALVAAMVIPGLAALPAAVRAGRLSPMDALRRG